MSDVPIGILLSGGIDSAGVAIARDIIGDKKIEFLAADFASKASDDTNIKMVLLINSISQQIF